MTLDCLVMIHWIVYQVWYFDCCSVQSKVWVPGDFAFALALVEHQAAHEHFVLGNFVFPIQTAQVEATLVPAVSAEEFSTEMFFFHFFVYRESLLVHPSLDVSCPVVPNFSLSDWDFHLLAVQLEVSNSSCRILGSHLSVIQVGADQKVDGLSNSVCLWGCKSHIFLDCR